MKITIVGGGNIGTQFAVHSAAKGHNVTVFSSQASNLSKQMRIINERDEVICEGQIENVTYDCEKAFSEVDLIFVTVPSFCAEDVANKIVKYVKPTAKIGLIPGGGGSECAFKKCIEKGCTVFGLQRVPSVARLVEKGKTVRAVGYRKELFLAAIPRKRTEQCCTLIENIFDIPCIALPNYLNVSLTPSNPVLHTTRLRVLFKEYPKLYDRVPYFYEEWNDESSRLLLECDAEMQDICRRLETLDLSYVKSLKEHYESDTPKQLTEKIRSIVGFKGLTTPMIRRENGWLPDFDSRYFQADFSYGLTFIVEVAKLLGLTTPKMLETLEWYQCVTGNKDGFSFAAYGIESEQDFYRFYTL